MNRYVQQLTALSFRQDAGRIIQEPPRVLACPRVSGRFLFAFLPVDVVCSPELNLYALPSYSAFAVLQSQIHEVWGRHFYCWHFGDVPQPPDRRPTLPFPKRFETDAHLEQAGRECYEFRASLMTRNREGLERTYLRLANPAETAPDILRLLELHAIMDRAVVDSYGWTDMNAEDALPRLIELRSGTGKETKLAAA